jgi:hypothetical protein
LRFPFFGNVQVVLDAFELHVANAGRSDAETRQPVRKNTLIMARSRLPCNVSVGSALSRSISCRYVSAGVKFFCTAAALTAAISYAVFHLMSPPVGQSMSFNGQRANEAHADPDAPDGGRLVDPTPAPASPSPTIGFVVP